MVQEVEDIFKIGIYRVNLDIDKKFWVEFCNRFEKKEPSEYHSNTGYQGHLKDYQNPFLDGLKKTIIEHSKKYVDYLSYKVDSLEVQAMWININYFKDINLPHQHGENLVSGVLYLQTHEKSGALVFKNPADRLDVQDEKVINYNNYNSGVWKIVPTEGELILFPSWFVHYVEPNLNETNRRISMSFNINTK
tara:strand:+ start:260 stop:835 length:576 start_codon:yes stop_codon:yes gene_type:complete